MEWKTVYRKDSFFPPLLLPLHKKCADRPKDLFSRSPAISFSFVNFSPFNVFYHFDCINSSEENRDEGKRQFSCIPSRLTIIILARCPQTNKTIFYTFEKSAPRDCIFGLFLTLQIIRWACQYNASLFTSYFRNLTLIWGGFVSDVSEVWLKLASHSSNCKQFYSNFNESADLSICWHKNLNIRLHMSSFPKAPKLITSNLVLFDAEQCWFSHKLLTLSKKHEHHVADTLPGRR